MEPHSLVGGMGEGSWSNWGLACGLQDQRLMARPPARAGGRSGLLTVGESGNPNGYSLPFSQRVPSHIPSPPSRWAGRYQRDKERAAGQVLRKKYGLPHTIPPEKGVQREEPLPSGVLSPISSQEMGPRLGKLSFPAVPTACAKTHNGPRPGGLRSRLFQRRRKAPKKPEAAARVPRGGFFHFSLFADLDEAQ